MNFQEDFTIELDGIFHIQVQGYLEIDDVTGYIYPKFTDLVMEDDFGNLITPDSDDYEELYCLVYQRDYEPEYWSD